MNDKLFCNILWYFPKNIAHKLLYFRYFHTWIDYRNPKNLNEKIHWLMVNQYGKKEALYTDKYLVKDIIAKQKIPNLLIPKTLYIYHDVDEINLDVLPQKFVLKCNHGSGNVIVCTDKNNFNLSEAKEVLRDNLEKNFARKHLEYHYKYIKPLVIAEEYLDDGNGGRPLDYKFFCFRGHAECALVCSGRETSLKRDYYDLNWQHLDYTLKKYQNFEKFPKPANFEKMIEIARKLSKDFSFVRVDLYNINGDIYFGEMTFTPAAGLNMTLTEEANRYLGSLVDIKKKEKER